MYRDRGAPRPARATWLALLGFAAACSNEPYPTATGSERRVSEEVFWVMCKRVAKDAYPNDVDGVRFNPVCDGEGDPENLLASEDAERLRALVARRSQIVAALDQVFGDLREQGVEPFADNEINRFLGEIVPFYDPPDELLPAAADAIADVLWKLIEPLDEQGKAKDPNDRNARRAEAVLAKFETVAKRKGYRPADRSLGFTHPILTYPQLDDVGKGLLSFVGKEGSGHEALISLLRAAALELAEDATPADASDPERLNTTLHAALELLLTEDDALAEPNQEAWVLRRGPDGFALPKGGNRDVTPFPLPDKPDGRAANAPATDAYEFFDASKTVLAGAMREAKAITERPDPSTPSVLDNLMRGLRPVMGPTTSRTYEFAGKPYTFQGPDLTQGAVLDLIHAVGVLASYPETADALELVATLLEQHEAAAAGPVAVSLKIKDRANNHPEAVLVGYDGTEATPSEFWDDVLAVAMRMAKRPAMLEKVIGSFTDPLSAHQGKLYGTWMRHKDDAPYHGAPITPNGPGPWGDGGAYTDTQRQQMNTPVVFEYSELVDRTQPDVGMNRSIWQRIMSLINALNGVTICNPDGSSMTVGVELLGSLKFPLDKDTYSKCEVLEIQDAVEIYSKAVAGRARLDIKDAAALSLGSLSAPLGIVKGVPLGSSFGTIFETYTDITGMTDTPNAPAMTRFISAPRNKFLATLMGKEQLSKDGVPMTVYEPNAMFHLENKQSIANNHSFVTAGVPLVTAFDDTELRETNVLGQPTGRLLDGYLFGDLMSVFHRHWGSRRDTPCELPITPGNEGCTQSLDPSAPLYAVQSNLVSYEPLLIEALIDEDLTGVLQRAAAKVKDVQIRGKNGITILANLAKVLLTPDPDITYRDGRKFAHTNTCAVPPGSIDPPASCGCPPGTAEAGDDKCALPNGRLILKGRIIQGGIPPIYLVLDALKKVDQAFEGPNADRLAPWRAARSKLADQLLAGELDDTGAEYRMKNQRARHMGVHIARWALSRIEANKGDPTWGPGLADRFAKTFSHPLAAGALDLLDKFWEDEQAAQQWANISSYIMDPARNREGFLNFLTALADTLVLIDREPDVTPLVQFAALFIAPDALLALDNGTVPSVEQGAAYLGLEVARNVMSVHEGTGRSAITKLLNNAVIAPSSKDAPANVLFDMIAEINRRDPSRPAEEPLSTGDQRAVFDQIRLFMVDADHGLKRLFSVIQNRKVHP
jgi:hypothetical protein